MVRINWDNRFLALFVGLIILFVLVVSWVIFNENKLTANASLPPASVAPTAYSTATQASGNQASSKPYAPAQSPDSTKQMYVRMQQPVVVTKLSSQHSSDQNYNIGYEWAAEYKITSLDQCKVLSAEYLNGCHAYIEVKHYVNNTDPSMNTPKY